MNVKNVCYSREKYLSNFVTNEINRLFRSKMLLKCIVWLIVLRFVENRCHYLLSQSNDKYDICLNDQCHQIIDPILIEVKPLDCKTNELYLKFSNYKTYQTFLNRIQKKKISDFFPSKSSNEQRILRIYLLQVDHDDKILDYQELIEIGHHLDIYQLFISNLTATNHYFPSIQYDQFNSQWNIIQINLFLFLSLQTKKNVILFVFSECKSLKRLNENPCEPKIVHPPLFPFHHESPLQRISTLISSSPSTSSLPIAQQQQQKQQQYILFVKFQLIFFC